MEAQLSADIRAKRIGGHTNDTAKTQAEKNKEKTLESLKGLGKAQRSDNQTKDSLNHQKRREQQQKGVASIYNTNGTLKADLEQNNERQL